MKLKEFVRNLEKIMKEHPETKDFLVVTSRDDEGNGFDAVYYAPSIGVYNKEGQDFIDYEGGVSRGKVVNAVCVN